MSHTGAVTADFAVLGAGVIGGTLAWRLQERGCRVVLVDGSLPGRGTSAAGFGWVNAYDKHPIEYFLLNAAGLDTYHRLAESGDAPWFHPSGYLRLAYDAETKEHQRRVVRTLSGWGYSAELLSRSDVEALEPDVVCNDVLGAAYMPRDGWVDTAAMVADVVSRAVNLGATLIANDPVKQFSAVSGSLVSASLASGARISAGAFVCCCGAASASLGAQLGVTIPLVTHGVTAPSSAARQEGPAVGFTVYTTPTHAVVQRIVHGARVTVRPTAGRGLAIGRSSVSPDYAWDDARLLGSVQGLLDDARIFVPYLAEAHVSEVRVGIRPLPADDLSIVGWAPEVECFYVVVTHSGATLALFLADAVAQELVERVEVEALSTFRPARFQKSAGG